MTYRLRRHAYQLSVIQYLPHFRGSQKSSEYGKPLSLKALDKRLNSGAALKIGAGKPEAFLIISALFA
jgi:hypothetical protein